ncbi:MAG: hypothetical protein M3R59_02200 [Verrucomicrobiota bacterium]|nr:hypothetical protein [Verrucomicrobiota bacterium]
MTPGLGVGSTSYLPAGHWSVSSTFRYYNSRQDVLGFEPLDHAIVYANTHVYAEDTAITYAVNRRLNVSLEIPVQYGTRETSIEHNPATGVLHTMRAFGVGNPRITANLSLFDPEKTPDRNVTLGLGVDIPIGQDDLKDTSYRANGNVQRPVDPAIQPADGGWGILVATHAFTNLYFPKLPETKFLQNTYLYLDAAYLVTPAETSSTEAVSGDIPGTPASVRYNSLPDQFLIRTGLTQTLWPKIGLSASAGVRFEGVPKHDVIGDSSGFRLAGNSLSFEPSLTFTRDRQSFSVSVPVAFQRYGSNSVGLERAGHGGPGFDAIADWQLILSYTRQF